MARTGLYDVLAPADRIQSESEEDSSDDDIVMIGIPQELTSASYSVKLAYLTVYSDKMKQVIETNAKKATQLPRNALIQLEEKTLVMTDEELEIAFYNIKQDNIIVEWILDDTRGWYYISYNKSEIYQENNEVVLESNEENVYYYEI